MGMEIIKNRARLDLFYGFKVLSIFLDSSGQLSWISDFDIRVHLIEAKGTGSWKVVA